ncbi:MAG TPA: xanthine dehydrogenase family protein molybdopterin-binding subunit [Pseudolabrys sp.]|jgi:carbon-monoxide dehydrogenase large subunit|nr:xanthine dehydrogenase family protein molybdopterin-binding subunit [Pseudolabrys sp.]
MKYGIGASVVRKEDDRFLRGRGQYVGDFRMAGLQEVAFVRSPVAHARLKQVRIPERFRDVVFTADDLVDVKPIVSAPPLKGFKRSAEPILATGKVRFVGEIIAMCVAPSRAEAEDIADAVSLDLEELPAVTDMLAACEPGSALVHEEWGDNVFVEFGENIWKDDLSGAAIKVSKTIRTARHCMFPMEGRGVVAYRDERLRNLTVITSTQFPHCVQTGLSECLGLTHGEIRVISPDVGGGFGYKGLLCREEVALAWLALRRGHPVRWLEDCREHLGANANCREHHYQITGYATADGKLLGIECVAHVDAGAYSSYPVSSSVEAAQIANLLPGPYVFSNYRCRALAVATNKCPIIPYRGVARSGICLAIEAVMDAIARKAGLEPYEVRLRNMVPPEQMPFDNLLSKHFDSGDHPECLRRAVQAIDVQRIRKRQQNPEPDGRRIGVGISFFVEQGAHGTNVLASWGRPIVPGYEQAQVKLTADGEVEIHVGTHSHGQGHETTYAQVAHEILGVDIDKIKVVQGDTMYTPYSTATWGSRSMVHGGGAVARASQLLARRAAQIGAWLLQTDVENVHVADGKVIAGDSSVTLREVARVWYLQPQNLPAGVDTGGLDVTAGYRAARDSGTFTYAAHAALVAVDPATGIVDILDYVVVEDGGTLVNPMIVDGQICGGTAQGIGTGLYEVVPFDAQGQPLASTMLDYMVPGATEVPDIRILHMQTPSPYTEFGIKGLGEGGAVGPPAAIVSAVNDALRDLKVEVLDLPLTPERILAAIETARPRGASA